MIEVTQVSRDNDEIRLVAASAACRAEEISLAAELSYPRHSMLYPAYMHLVNTLETIRVRCRDIALALRAHRKKMREREN
jgi:hypothetical protein